MLHKADLPVSAASENATTHRSIKINNEEVHFNKGFTDLHTKVYKKILGGNGYGIDDARASVKLVQEIRNAKVSFKDQNFHPGVIKLLKR